MAEEENVMRKELGLIGGISLAAGSTIGIPFYRPSADYELIS